MSAVTGRTECDVTLFDVERRDVLGKVALADKQGETRAAAKLIRHLGGTLPPGVFTFDCGITSPRVLRAIADRGHEVLAQVKGNCGDFYYAAMEYDWDALVGEYETIDVGHGRKELRCIKRISIKNFAADLWLKYKGITHVLMVESYRQVGEDEPSFERRIYIASKGLKDWTLRRCLSVIRAHWIQENGLHWVKDAILKEDCSQERRSNSSQILGALKDFVVYLGFRLAGSVRRFIDEFSAAPHLIFERIIYDS